MIAARIAFFSWSVFGPCLSAIQSVVVSVWIRSMPACASGVNGVRARKVGQGSGATRFWMTVSVPQSSDGNRSMPRSPKEPGIPAAAVEGKLL